MTQLAPTSWLRTGFLALCLLMGVATVQALPTGYNILPIFPDGLYIRNSTVMIPMRPLVEILGAQVTTDGKLITVSLKGKSFTYSVAKTTAKANGKPLQLTVAPFAIAEVGYVPLEAFMTALGGRVDIDPDEEVATVTLPNSKIQVSIPFQPVDDLATFHKGGIEVYNDLYLVNLDGTGLRRLTYAVDGVHSPNTLSISADGTRIAFLRDNAIYIRGAQSAAEKCLARCNWQTRCYEPILSPDGRYVAWVQESIMQHTSQLFLAASTGDGTPITLTGRTPCFSPDSKQLAYAATDNGQEEQLTLINNDGTHARVLGSGFAPHFSADGKLLVFSRRYATGAESLVTYWLAGPNADKSYTIPAAEQKTNHCEDFVGFGRDGKSIVFQKGTGDDKNKTYTLEYYLMTPDRGTSRPLADLHGPLVAQLAYTADGRALVYQSVDNRSLNVKSLSTGTVSQILPNLQVWAFMLTPDGKQILFTGRPRSGK